MVNVSWRTRCRGNTTRVGKMRNAYERIIGKRGTLGRPRCRWENNMKMVLKETGI
jgi:hypothetical protein